MNIHKRSQELASSILEFKKQKRGIDAAIQKVEKELERIYDNAGIIHEITVACVECKECGQTHAVLPSIAIFHSQFSIQFAVQLMNFSLKYDKLGVT